jgi:anti-sigma factor RsiW
MPSLERNDRQLRQYLLGLLPEEASLAMEERLFGDAELFEQVFASRNSLLRDYARKRLTSEESAQLEKQLALSPELAAEALAVSKAVASDRRHAQWWFAAAAAIVFFAVVAFAFLPSRRAGHLAMRSTVQSAPSVHPEPATTAFFLSAGVTRSQSGVQQIRLPDGVSTVALQAEVRTGFNCKWNAALLSGKDRLLEKDGLAVTTNSFFSYVTVTVASRQLYPGHFALVLTSSDGATSPQRIDFEVSTQRRQP